MINVNALITNCFQRVSLVDEGEVPTGTQASAGLADLQCLISELNTENDLLQNVQTLDTYVSETIRFAVKPDRWFEVSSTDEIQTRIDEGKCLVYDIFKVGNTFYVIHPNGASLTFVTDEAWSHEMLKKFWPTFFVPEIPDRVLGLARRLGTKYIPLFPGDKMAVDSFTKMSLPTMYTSETETEEVHFPHLTDDPNYQPYVVEYFKISINSIQCINYRVTFLKGIPKITLKDTLHISSKYESMIEDGLCVKLCQRYKLMDIKPDYEADFETAKRGISRINAANRPMTYQVGRGRGWDAGYYELAGGDF